MASTLEGVDVDTRPKRKTLESSEWRITVELVHITPTGETARVLPQRPPLRFADSALNNKFADSGRAIATYIDDAAQILARRAKSHRKKK